MHVIVYVQSFLKLVGLCYLKTDVATTYVTLLSWLGKPELIVSSNNLAYSDSNTK